MRKTNGYNDILTIMGRVLKVIIVCVIIFMRDDLVVNSDREIIIPPGIAIFPPIKGNGPRLSIARDICDWVYPKMEVNRH